MPRDLLADPPQEAQEVPVFSGRPQPRDLFAESQDGQGEDVGAVSALFGVTPRQLEERGMGIRAGLLQTGEDIYREGISPILSGGSTFASGIPKTVAALQGQKELVFPEQRSVPGKVLRVASETAGYVAGAPAQAAKFAGRAIGGAAKHLPRFAGKALATRVASGAGAGAAGFATAGDTLESRKELATTGALIGGAIPIVASTGRGVGGLVTRTGRWIAKQFGGISDETVKIIKELGADRVFEPMKARIDYLGTVVAPKARQRIISAVTDFSEKSRSILKSLDIKSDDIDELSKLSPETRQSLRDIFRGSTDDLAGSFDKLKDAAGRAFRDALPDEAQINVRGPLHALKNSLEQQGWIDATGAEIKGAGVSNKTKRTLVRILHYYSKLGQEGQVMAKGAAPLTSRQYLNLLSELEASTSGQPAFDRLSFEAQRNVRNAAAKQIPAMVNANKTYADAMRLQELQKVFEKIDNVVKLESGLLRLKQVERGQLHKQWKTILGKDLYDDVLAHLANQDFNLVSNLPGVGGALYPSRAGLLRHGIAGGAKRYYRDIAPRTKRARQAMKFIGQPVSELLEQAGVVR